MIRIECFKIEKRGDLFKSEFRKILWESEFELSFEWWKGLGNERERDGRESEFLVRGIVWVKVFKVRIFLVI